MGRPQAGASGYTEFIQHCSRSTVIRESPRSRGLGMVTSNVAAIRAPPAASARRSQHSVRKNQRLVHVVRHQKRDGFGLLLHRVKQVLHPQAGECVEGRERLVEQQDAGSPGKGTREASALRHTTGDLPREMIAEFA